MSHEQYQTVKEIADLLKVSEVTVRRWIKDGELRAIEVGKGWRISSQDLDAFLESHATRPAISSGSEETSQQPDDGGAQTTKGQKA